jgi:hypothetical protein
MMAMMRTLLLSLSLIATASGSAAQPPAAALDKAAQRLAALLQPSDLKDDGATPRPAPRAAPRLLPHAEASLPKADLLPPALPRAPGKAPQPRAVQDAMPFARSFGRPGSAETVELPQAPLVRLWSWDSETPIPVPILGTAARERASLADPSLEASVLATQTPVQLDRAAPVSFQSMNLPNPFEHAEAVRLRTPLEEQAAPILTPRPLGK